MRPIIETVDRYGLTKNRLQKHKSAANAFVENASKHSVSSEAAVKYQKRIAKYGYRLFTFLDYDHVPWHNNNAEHAVHAFARYRSFADGHFTMNSVSDYLAILSVFQTCEYRGINVLDFLLSGETSLERYVNDRCRALTNSAKRWAFRARTQDVARVLTPGLLLTGVSSAEGSRDQNGSSCSSVENFDGPASSLDGRAGVVDCRR